MDSTETALANGNCSAVAKDCRIERPARLAADGKMDDFTLANDAEALPMCERRKNRERGRETDKRSASQPDGFVGRAPTRLGS